MFVTDAHGNDLTQGGHQRTQSPRHQLGWAVDCSHRPASAAPLLQSGSEGFHGGLAVYFKRGGTVKPNSMELANDRFDADHDVAVWDGAQCRNRRVCQVAGAFRGYVFPMNVFDAGCERLDELQRIATTEPTVAGIEVDPDGFPTAEHVQNSANTGNGIRQDAVGFEQQADSQLLGPLNRLVKFSRMRNNRSASMGRWPNLVLGSPSFCDDLSDTEHMSELDGFNDLGGAVPGGTEGLSKLAGAQTLVNVSPNSAAISRMNRGCASRLTEAANPNSVPMVPPS